MRTGDGEKETEGWSSSDRSDRLTACGETLAVVRKKALLRILARREADRANIRPTDGDIQAMSDQFRQSFGFADADALAQWLQASGLSPASYATAMRDFTVVRLIEEYYSREIDDLVADQVAISTARTRQAEND